MIGRLNCTPFPFIQIIIEYDFDIFHMLFQIAASYMAPTNLMTIDSITGLALIISIILVIFM